ncbi:hypothetical protein ABIB51_002347 [Arthrobacter sp. UYCu712]
MEASIKANSPRREEDAVPVLAGEAAVANPWAIK